MSENPPETLALPHLAVIRLTGADRVALLQGQASNDVRRVNAARGQLTSFSTPKGRVYAVAMLVARGDEHLIITEREIAAALARRLGMYVLRSDARVAPPDEHTRVLGRFPASLAPRVAAWSVATDDGTTTLQLPDGRALIITDAAGDDAVVGVDEHAWRAADVAAGLPTVLAATQERWVPQMLNLDALGAIALDKGCYTGQEIVARMHYLGKLKQRMFRARSAAPIAPGTALHAVDGDGQSVGEVVIGAPDGDGFGSLVVLRIGAAGDALRTADGQPLTAVTALVD